MTSASHPSVPRCKPLHHSLGEWLRGNSEAIRGTAASRIAGGGNQSVVFQHINPDGSEKNLAAAGAAKNQGAALPRGWRSTSNPGCIYLHLFDRPANGLIRLNGSAAPVKQVTMLGLPQRRPFDFQPRTTGLKLDALKTP